tara:strand:+ start:548 stop:1231 length:684 start_codon:yes stop_codon:yes gene_type:complete
MNQTKKILSDIDNIFITNKIYNLYHITPSSKVVTNKTFNTKKTDLFNISHINKRLWVMYYLLRKETFETNLFKIEQEFRIKNIEMINANPDLLKPIKLKHYDIVHDIMHSKHIDIFSLQAMCIYHNITCMYVEGKKYYILGNNEPSHIIIEDKDGMGIYFDANQIKLQYYKNNYFYVENIKKPLKSISAYSSSDIQNICLQINIPTNTIEGKKLTKKELYEEIIRNL